MTFYDFPLSFLFLLLRPRVWLKSGEEKNGKIIVLDINQLHNALLKWKKHGSRYNNIKK